MKTQVAEVKGQLTGMPTAIAFGELKGRVESLPTTAKFATILTIVGTLVAIAAKWPDVKTFFNF